MQSDITRLKTNWGVEANFIAVDYVMCLTLSKDDFDEVVDM